MSLTIGVPSETFAGEKRVATVPEVVDVKASAGLAMVEPTAVLETVTFSAYELLTAA